MTFGEILKKTGMSTRGASALLNVRFDTVRNWKYSKSKVPDNVMKQMQQYANAAQEIFSIENNK